ncbi:MAG: hypothetical protein JWO56_2681 [Acidobacteria bacterium]|nr:hypothetical protein [Acidobacteriota bacterium]
MRNTVRRAGVLPAVAGRLARRSSARGNAGLLVLLAFLALPAAAQIQDNSFLVEEAYNQEPGVVQHISFFQRSTRGRDWVSSFTQEWPAPSLKHQLSYTLTAAQGGDRRRFGDVLLNYRYQLVGDGKARVAVSPRITAVVGTHSGDSLAVQLMLPVSTVINDHFVAHWNAGGTFGHGSPAWTAAQSVVWLAHPRFNALVETVWSGDRNATDLVVSPGIRWSYDRPGDLQIVPGLAFPMSLRGAGGRGVILYLSFEHPFRRAS